jgi:hypothetical protein
MTEKFSKFGGIFPIEQATPGDDGKAIPMTLEEFAQAHYAVEQALKFFNYEPLKKRLRTATPLALELNIFVDIFEGKIKKPKHRMAKPNTRSRKLCLALSVVAKIIKNVPRKAAIRDVAKASGASTSTVSTALRDNAHLFPGLVE